MYFPERNIHEYECPHCHEIVFVKTGQDEIVCPDCNKELIIDWDGDYDDFGKPYDCTQLRIKNEN